MINFAKQINNKPNRQGNYVVYLRIAQGQTRRFVKSSVTLKKKNDWNTKKQEVRSSCPDHKKLNEILDNELEKLKETYRILADDGVASPDKIAEKAVLHDTANNLSFLAYTKQRTQEIYDAGQYRNYKKYNNFYNKLVLFQTDKNGKLHDLTFKELSTSYVAKFDNYLHTLKNERQPEKLLHVNTIEVQLKVFKSLIKRAIEVDKIMNYDENPFLGYKISSVKTYKEKLNASEIDSIRSLDLQKDSALWIARDCFLFSFYCAGIRAADLIQLRWCNITGDRLNYEMGKNHKFRDIKLVPQAQEILEHYSSADKVKTDYIFPLLDGTDSWSRAITQAEKDVLPLEEKVKMYGKISSKNAYINKNLKTLASMANISKVLSMHISRHSFARIAKDKGIDNSHVQSLLAHSSIKITENYMGNFDTTATDQTLTSIFMENNQYADLLEQLKALPADVVEKLMATIKEHRE